MIRLIIVAGSNTENLAKFFEKRGTFEIVAAYDSLSKNVSQIQNKVIAADKLLYLFNTAEASDMNIKDDMQVLSTYLKNDIFFKPGEIVFMTDKSDLAKVAVRFFTTAMEDCGKTDYSIKTTSEKLSYVTIYGLLMGTSGSVDFKNTYTTLYKVERNADTSTEYQPKDDRDLVVEPFNMDSVVEYAGRQKVAQKADTGAVYTDEANTQLPKIDAVNFKTLELKEEFQPKLIFITGDSKSGKSSWAAQLAQSAFYADKSVCLLDMTSRPDILEHLTISGSDVEQSSLAAILAKQSQSHTITVAFPSNIGEQGVAKEFMYLLANKTYFTCDVIIIVCNPVNLRAFRRFFVRDVNEVLTVNSTFADVANMCEYLDVEDSDAHITIALNDIIPDAVGDFATPESIKDYLPIEAKVVKTAKFTKIDMKGKLFTALFGE